MNKTGVQRFSSAIPSKVMCFSEKAMSEISKRTSVQNGGTHRLNLKEKVRRNRLYALLFTIVIFSKYLCLVDHFCIS